jgi:hypothetical protein
MNTLTLCTELRALAEDLSEAPAKLLIEAADRLELLQIEAEDYRAISSRKQEDANFWRRKLIEAARGIGSLKPSVLAVAEMGQGGGR